MAHQKSPMSGIDGQTFVSPLLSVTGWGPARKAVASAQTLQGIRQVDTQLPAPLTARLHLAP